MVLSFTPELFFELSGNALRNYWPGVLRHKKEQLIQFSRFIQAAMVREQESGERLINDQERNIPNRLT